VNQGLWQHFGVPRAALRRWAVPVAIALICLALGFGEDAARAWGEYRREAIEGGEWWRILSAHFVHLGWGHLWLNLAALLLIAMLLEETLSMTEWVATTLVAALAIDLGLYLWNNDVKWYVGLSGVLHGYVAVAAMRLLEERPGLGIVLGLGIGLKLVWEQAVGPIPFTQASAGGPVVVAAHLYGAAGGVAVAAAGFLLRRGSKKHVL
jgi:rhomboid family GlyGly-CTERM serine protease